MLLGIIGYFLFAKVDILHPLKPFVFSFVRVVMPLLIFIQLLFAFCKIDPKDLKIRVWHIWLLLFQLVVGLLFAIVLIFLPVSCFYKEVLEGAMVCFVCPTATAAVIITAKLGGRYGRSGNIYFVIQFFSCHCCPSFISINRATLWCIFF